MNYSLEYGKQKDDDFISRLLNTHDEICRKTLESIMDSNLIEGSHKLRTNHEVLYHYCSLNSFFSIINSNCFWLSYPKFMNDPSEYKNSKEIMLKNLVLSNFLLISARLHTNVAIIKRIPYN